MEKRETLSKNDCCGGEVVDVDPGEEMAVPLLDSLSDMAEEVHDPEQRAEIALWLMAAAVAGVGVSTMGEPLGTRRQRQPSLNRWPLQR